MTAGRVHPAKWAALRPARRRRALGNRYLVAAVPLGAADLVARALSGRYPATLGPLVLAGVVALAVAYIGHRRWAAGYTAAVEAGAGWTSRDG